MPLANVPYLEGWVLLADAADDLGISRQALYEAAGRDRVDSIRKVGRKRPTYVIREAEIPRIRETLSPDAQRRGRLRALAQEEREEVDDVENPVFGLTTVAASG